MDQSTVAKTKISWLAKPWLGPAIAVVIILLAAWWGLLKPQWAKWQAVKEQLVQQQNQLIDLQSFSSQISALHDQYLSQQRDYLSSFSRINKLVPSQLNYAQIFYDFQQLIEGNGLVLLGLRISPADVQAPSPKATTVSLTVAGGNYPALKRILDILERNLRLTDVISLSFDAQVSSYTISARIYSLQ